LHAVAMSIMLISTKQHQVSDPHLAIPQNFPPSAHPVRAFFKNCTA
jgi:hypothetical protein